MAKAKKCLCVVLAVMMVIGMFSFSAIAADTETATFTVTTDANDPASAGDTITVTVSLTTDYNVGPYGVPIQYDADAFDYVAGSISVSEIFGTGTTDSAVTSSTDGQIIVQAWPTTSGSPTTDVATDLVLFTFQLTASDSASGSYVIDVMDNQKTADNAAGKWFCGSFSSTDPKTATLTSMGQTFSKVSATVNFGSAEADLAITSDYTSSGIIIDKNKTFGSTYSGVVYGFTLGDTLNAAYYTARLEATNSGTITVVKTPYVSRPASYGTGTTIQVYNSDGTLSKTYVIVIFGDVSGNGKIGTEDNSVIYSAVQGTSEITDLVKLIAANVVVSGRTTALKTTSLYQVRSDDSSLIYACVNSGSTIDQASVAQAHVDYHNTNYQ